MRNSRIAQILITLMCPTIPQVSIDRSLRPSRSYTHGKGGKTAHKHSGVAAQRRQARKLRNRKNNR